MSTSSLSNPYAPADDGTSCLVTPVLESNRDELYAYGPLTYETYLAATAPGVRVLCFLFFLLSAVFCLHLKAVFGWGESISLGCLLGAISVPILCFVRRFTSRTSFERIPEVKRWVINTTGIHQDYVSGESDFTPFEGIDYVIARESVITLLTKNAVQIHVPRAGFSEEEDWQLFQLRIGEFVRGESQNEKNTKPIKLAEQEGSILVCGPMTDEEATAAYRVWKDRLTGVKSPIAKLLMIGIWAASLGFIGFQLVLKTTSLVHVLYLVPVLAPFALLVVGYILLGKGTRRGILEDCQSIDQWRLNEYGIAFVKRNILAEYKWETFPTFRIEALGIFLLGPDPSIMVFVPRSGFQSKADWETACDIVTHAYEE